MSGDQNKDVMRRLYEDVFNTGNVTLADEIIASDCIDHNVDSPHPVPAGPGPIKGFVTFFRAAFPDAHWTINDLIAEGDRVAGIVTLTGTNTGNYRGLTATGKRVDLSGLVIFQIADGKVVERWGGFDALGLLQQLGIAEQMGQQVGRPSGPPAGPPRAKDGDMTQEEQNKALMRRMYEDLFNKGDLSSAGEIIAENAVDHTDEAGGGPNQGQTAVQRIQSMVDMLKTGMPDGHWTIEQMLAEGDLVGARVSIEGTNTGPFMGMPPSGKTVKTYETVLCRIVDGKLTDNWHQIDVLGMRRQLMGDAGGGPPGGGPPGGGPPGGFPGGGPPGGFGGRPGGGPPGGRPGGGPPGGFPGGGPPGGFPGGGPPGGFPGGGPPGGFPGGGPPGGFPGGGPPGGFPGGGPPGGFPGGGPPGGFPGGGPPGGFPGGGPPSGPPETLGADRQPSIPAPPEGINNPGTHQPQLKAILYALYDEAFNKQNYQVAEDVIDTDMIDHAMPIQARNPNIRVRGANGIIRFIQRFADAFPDQVWTVEQAITEGDLLMGRCSVTGTHTGVEFEGVQAAGNAFRIETLVIFRVRDFRIVERWAQIDTMGLMAQLRGMPTGGGPPGGHMGGPPH